MKKHIITFILTLLGFASICFFTISEVQAKKIYIDIGEAKVKKSLMALPPFQFYGSQAQKSDVEKGQKLYEVVHTDLDISSLFSFISPEAYLEDVSEIGLKPAPSEKNGFKFENWKTIGTEFLVRGGYKINNDKIEFEAYVYYVPQGKTVLSKTYTSKVDNLRQVAHTFANDIVKALTGQKSMFRTKIVASSNRGAKRGGKEIWIMDWDGANARKITKHRTIAISPAWSPDGKKIAYTAYMHHKKANRKNPDLLIYNLESGRRELISYRKGLNSGAAFMPDGKHILLTISRNGNPDIYRMTTDGKNIVPLTHGPAGAMYVEPDPSPNGEKIAFSSTRGGKPMIYSMNASGSNIKRLTFAGRYNASPDWSPDGKKIVFAGYDKGHFDIFIMNKDGTGLSRLTSAKKSNGKWANNENPTFSPDGRHIIFVSDRTGKSQLYIIRPDGTNERRITHDRFNYYQPKWSPFLN